MGVEAMKKGAVDFLTKPFPDKELLQAVRKRLKKIPTEERNMRRSLISADVLTGSLRAKTKSSATSSPHAEQADCL